MLMKPSEPVLQYLSHCLLSSNCTFLLWGQWYRIRWVSYFDFWSSLLPCHSNDWNKLSLYWTSKNFRTRRVFLWINPVDTIKERKLIDIGVVYYRVRHSSTRKPKNWNPLTVLKNMIWIGRRNFVIQTCEGYTNSFKYWSGIASLTSTVWIAPCRLLSGCAGFLIGGKTSMIG